MDRRYLLKGTLAALAALGMATTAAACGSGGSGGTADGSATGSADASSGKPVLNMGVFPALRPLELVRETGSLEKMGYTVKWHDFLQGAPAEAAAMASGSIDFSEADTSGLEQVAAKSPGLVWYVGNGATNYVALVATKGSGVTSIKDLAGKKVGGANPNTAPTAVLQMALAKQGMQLSDVKGISLTGPSEPGAAQKKAVDAFTTYVPYSTQMLRDGTVSLLATASQVYGKTWLGGGIGVRPAFAKKHKQAVVDVLKAVIEAENLIRNQPQKAYTALSKASETSLADVKYSYTHHLVGPAKVTPNKADILAQSKVLTKYGVIKVPNLNTFVDGFVHPEYAKLAAQ